MKAQDVKKILLLGTIYTMEEDFYANRLKANFDIDVIIPNSNDRKIISDIIYDELCKGLITESSKQEYLRIINQSIANGAEAALLACTEIPLLVKDGDADIPLFETTKIHVEKACAFALGSMPHLL